MNKKIYFDNNDLLITNAVNEDGFLRIEGTAAHFDTPNLNGEIVNASSFDNFFLLYNEQKLNPALNYNHDSTMLIGGIDNIFIKDNALCCSAHLNADIAFCKDTLIPMVESGDIKSFSTEGYVGYNDIEEREDGNYFAKNFLLTAIAIVSVPADYKSAFTIKNYFDEQRAAQMKKLRVLPNLIY